MCLNLALFSVLGTRRLKMCKGVILDIVRFSRNFENFFSFIMMDLKRLNEVGLMNGPSLVECSKESSDAELSLAEKVVSFAVVGLGSAGHSRLEAILSDEAERCGFELAGNDDDRNNDDDNIGKMNGRNRFTATNLTA